MFGVKFQELDQRLENGRNNTICTRNLLTPTAVFVTIILIVAFSSHGAFAKDLLSNRGSLMNDEIPWNIMAKSLTYNEKEGTYLAEGDVVITKAKQTLYTQRAVFNVKTGIAKVSGGLRLETDGDIITGKEGSF